MAFAYTTKISPNLDQETFDQTNQALQFAAQQTFQKKQAIAKQLQARRDQIDKSMNAIEGYDISKIIPAWRPFFQQKNAEKITKFIDLTKQGDVVGAKQVLTDISNIYNWMTGHNNGENVQEAIAQYQQLANDPNKLAAANKTMPVHQQLVVSLEGFERSKMAFEGANTEFKWDENSDTFLYRPLNPETGEPMKDWDDATNWDNYANPGVFQLPTAPRAGKSAITIGETVVRANVKGRNKDLWDGAAANESARAIVDSGTASEDGMAARAWAVMNLMDESHMNNAKLTEVYMNRDKDSEMWNLNKDYLEDIDNTLVKKMVDASYFAPKPEDVEKPRTPTQKERDRLNARADFDSKKIFESEAFPWNSGLIYHTQEGMVADLTQLKDGNLRAGTEYVLTNLGQEEYITMRNPNFGEEDRRIHELDAELGGLINMGQEGSAMYGEMKAERDQLMMQLYFDNKSLQPEVFDISPRNIVFLPNGNISFMNLDFEDSDVGTIIINEKRDHDIAQQLLSRIRKAYNDPTITFDELRAGLSYGPNGMGKIMSDQARASANSSQAAKAFDDPSKIPSNNN